MVCIPSSIKWQMEMQRSNHAFLNVGIVRAPEEERKEYIKRFRTNLSNHTFNQVFDMEFLESKKYEWLRFILSPPTKLSDSIDFLNKNKFYFTDKTLTSIYNI